MAEEQPADSRLGGPRTGRAARVTALCWVGVLVVTAVFHVLRGAPVDAVIYTVGAGVLLLDTLGWLRVPLLVRLDRDTASRRVVVGVLIAVAAISLALTPLYGGTDTVIVAGLGVLLLPVAWADRPGRAEPATAIERRAVRRAALLWSALIVVACAWEVAAFFLGRSMPAREEDFPALSDLLDPLIAWPPARAVLVALWLLGGYALLRRGRAR